jgi:hypothetical protein
MLIIPFILVLIIMCSVWAMEWNQERILKWCFKSCTKKKVMPVFVIPGPDFKLNFDETPTKVFEIQPDEI